jgi:hypothetical protein
MRLRGAVCGVLFFFGVLLPGCGSSRTGEEECATWLLNLAPLQVAICEGQDRDEFHLLIKTDGEESVALFMSCEGEAGQLCIPSGEDPVGSIFFEEGGEVTYCTEVDIVEGAVDGCLQLSRYPPATGANHPTGAPNVVFPSTTTLPDGRVLVAGGFSKVVDDGARLELGQASNRAYIYDPANGELRQAANEMNKGRGAHAAVYLPGPKLVLLVGGAERIYQNGDDSCFPFHFEHDSAGTVGFSYELFDIMAEKFLTWDGADWPDVGHELGKDVRRVFPTLTMLDRDRAIVSGGGNWPSCASEMETESGYLATECYRAKSDLETGGFLEAESDWALVAMRAAHSAVAVVDSGAEGPILFVGGSEAEAVDLFTPDEDGMGSILQLVVDGSFDRRPFFHQMTRLEGSRWLLSGGLDMGGATLAEPSGASLHTMEWKDGALSATPVVGDWQPRYFHGAVTHRNGWVTLLGGFPAQGAPVASPEVAFFHPEFGLTSDKEPPELAVAGAGVALLPNDCILVAGGVESVVTGLEMGSNTVPLGLRVYCPSHLCPAEHFPELCR